VGVGGHPVEVGLEGVGAGVLQDAGVPGPPARGGAVRLAMTGMATCFRVARRVERYRSAVVSKASTAG